MALKVRVITPDQTVLDDSVEEVILPSSSGLVGILSGHAPLLTALETGVLRVRINGWENIAITDGFAEVEENEVKVLVNAATKASDINLEEARQAFNAAQSKFEGMSSEAGKDYFDARQEFKRARALFMAAGGMA
ncbi:ATP synthase F1 subcomplex epsilon subunit [[Leptolyngbya] sp. PCC 7376]|uniref:ATP synthase F1 subunit epsilon n=1 Tax=[Leptolyngbya] sp. PCC 7376 TaxID=111781 RepID=UPI00029F3078|nr:ATP synthase F1 subunit epsilon [[Leptolyngbya] sp. PCC 7376]AFY40155.1 ATP synthase F1 subcomplex epsilon subunit [[Leptolyngbya] sp. PCC 7376]